MRKVLAFLLTFFVVCSLSAQEAFQAPLVEESLLLDVASEDYTLIVGERGHILRSQDGKAFQQVNVPTNVNLTAVTILGDDAWAVGHDATILHSSDQGNTWKIQMQAPELEKPFLDVLFFDQQHGIVAGAYGLFFRTRDGGKTWLRELHATLLNPYDQEYLDSLKKDSPDFYEEELRSILPHLNRLEEIGDVLYLVGEAGLVAKSVNQGERWQRMDTGYEGSFFDIKALDENTLLLAGLRGHVFVSRDGGDWQNVKTCLSGALNAIVPKDDKTVMLFGNNGYIVTLPRPLETSDFDPWARSEDCQPVANLSTRQLDDKASIVNAIRSNDEVLAVTANGIKHITLN